MKEINTALLMFNGYMQLRIDVLTLLSDNEMLTFYAMIAHITVADELAEYGGNLLITDNEKEITILNKMTTIDAAIKINDTIYKINPRFGCCINTGDEDPEQTALIAIKIWDKMQKERIDATMINTEIDEEQRRKDDAIIDQWDDYLATVASDYQLDRYDDNTDGD